MQYWKVGTVILEFCRIKQKQQLLIPLSRWWHVYTLHGSRNKNLKEIFQCWQFIMTTLGSNYNTTNSHTSMKLTNNSKQISCQLQYSYNSGISDGDVLLISDNGNLNAHQVHSEFIFGIVWAYDLIFYINL